MDKLYKKLFMTGVLLCAGVISVSACSGNANKALGLNKEAPDEFTVVAKAPLVLPPDYNLVPPGEISASADDVRPQSNPKDILFDKTNESKSQPNGYDEATNELLAMAGADKDNSDIRRTIDKETNTLIEENQDLVDKIMFWNDEIEDPTEVTVNAQKEKERISNNLKLEKALSEGETPSIQP